MKEKTCCFTGHRNLPKEDIPTINYLLEQQVSRLIKKGYIRFACGGALGFDTLAAQTVLRLREKNPEIQLVLFLPCREQDKYWTVREKRTYREILARADQAVFIGETYYRGCMQKRNRLLAEGSSACICYYTKNIGGTDYTVKYAQKLGVEVINLAEEAAAVIDV